MTILVGGESIAITFVQNQREEFLVSSDNGDDQLKQLLNVESQAADTKRVEKVLRRARASVGQRDTMVFALVRVWSTLAELLAPFFALLAQRTAEAKHSNKHRPTSKS